jgi:hypothetical protein
VPSRHELKEFQKRTVAFVLNKLEDRSTYAIADEVGLGKTWTVAEIGLQLALKKSRQANQTIFYIAPSFELIDQNLKTIESHIHEQCKNLQKDIVVVRMTSRLSRIDHDLAVAQAKNPNRPHIFVVGLSPETSFRIKGKGSIAEREVLAALMSFGKRQNYKQKVENYFWNLEGPVSAKYRDRVRELSNKRALGKNIRSYQKCKAINLAMDSILKLPDPRLSASSRKAVRTKLGDLRKAVVNRWMEGRRICTLLILDEWHKYKAACFQDGLLSQFIAKIRTHESAKLLLVSATPFAVHFEDTEQGARRRLYDQDDFKSLFELFHGKEQAIAAYDEFRELQDNFLTSIENYVQSKSDSERTANEMIARNAREAYEEALLEICVRTERPTTQETANTLDLGAPPTWDDTEGSLQQFLKRFVQIDTHSPVSQMWLDGHKFLEHKEYRIAKSTLNNLSGDHWKLRRLRDQIEHEYKNDKLHSMRSPPLWITSSLGTEKHLIFTEYAFLPHEIAAGLKYGEVKNTKIYNGNVLGYFPLPLKSSTRRSTSEKEVQRNIFWVYFYPWVAFEGDAKPTLSIKVLNEIFTASHSLVDAVLNIDSHFCHEDLVKRARLDQRRFLMSKSPSRELKSGAKEYLQDIFVGKKSVSQIPGAILARCATKLSLAGGPKVADIRRQEEALLEVANSLLKLFASPEAQMLGKKKRRGAKNVKRENMHLKFALWYCRQYNLEGTLGNYFELLSGNTTTAKDVLSEVASAIGLKRATNMSRCARPFNDKKENDNAEDDVGALSPKSLRSGFNSPFPPYVLVSTSIGQEGLDFHLYCDRVIHWSPPPSPSVLQQREGRVDRYRSLQNRKITYGATTNFKSEKWGLSPDFVVLDPTGKRLNKTQRFVMYLPYSFQAARWKKCVQRMYYNNLLIGVPDPLSVEKRFQSLLGGTNEERQSRLEQFKEHCVSLMPRDLAV